MEPVNSIDLDSVYAEVVNKLRAKLNSADPRERVEQKTLTQTIVTPTSKILLSATRAAFVRNVYKNTVLLKYGEDYQFVYHEPEADRGKVVFTTQLEEDDEISIQWGEVKTNKANFVWDDFPRVDLSEESYPRVGCNITLRSDPAGMGNTIQQVFSSDVLVQIKIVDKNKLMVRKLLKMIRDFLLSHSVHFFSFRYIRPDSLADYSDFSDNTNTTFTQYLEFTAPTRYEIITQEAEI